jgi:uncharacterized membrane protein YjgN (DUF898 family)
MGEININIHNKRLNGVFMSDVKFDVVLKGLVAGFDKEKVQQSFSELFALDDAKVERIFSTTNANLKKNVTEAIAQQYVAKLTAIGVDAVLIAREPILALETIEHSGPDADSAPGSHSEPHSASSQAHPSLTANEETVLNFYFTGKGFEYFKIWIVNILLSIVTLGIYSAWAKVRNHQYFYGNTHFNNSTFEYTATPIQVLKGRIIAFVLLVIFAVAGRISPILSLVLTLLFLIALPWIAIMSLKFNARNTRYRNLAFRFHGDVWGAAKAFIFWPLLGVFSLFALMPFAWKKQTQYIFGNSAYGTADFSFDVSVKEYYKMLLIILGAGVVFMIIFGALFGFSIAGLATKPAAGLVAMIPIMLIYLAFYLFVGAYFMVTMANIQLNNTQLQEHRMGGNWDLFSYAKLLAVNTLLILCTLGLYIPFAKIKTAAYRADHTQFIAVGDLDQFIAAEKEHVGALGEGVSDLFDVDISV